MNPFSARAASSSTRILAFPLQNGLGRSPLRRAWQKNLIRSGLKFNHSLKELILGAIGGWCPLHLIVAQLLHPAFRFRRISRLYQTSFFSLFSLSLFISLSFPFSLSSQTLRTFSCHDRASPGNNLLCIDIKPCYLIELPSSLHLKRRGRPTLSCVGGI